MQMIVFVTQLNISSELLNMTFFLYEYYIFRITVHMFFSLRDL